MQKMGEQNQSAHPIDPDRGTTENITFLFFIT